MTESKKTLKESIKTLEALKAKQEKILQIKAARMTQKVIDALKERIENEKRKE